MNSNPVFDFVLNGLNSAENKTASLELPTSPNCPTQDTTHPTNLAPFPLLPPIPVPNLFSTNDFTPLLPNQQFPQQVIKNIGLAERYQTANEKLTNELKLSFIRTALQDRRLEELPSPLSAPLPFPIEKTPDALQQLILQVAMSLHVTVEAAAMGALGALFIAARGKFIIRVNRSYTEPLTNYLLIVAPSGGRKSAVNSFYKAPFLAYERKLQQANTYDTIKIQTTADIIKKIRKKKIDGQIDLLNIEDIPASQMFATAQKIAQEIEEISTDLQCPCRPSKLFADASSMKTLAEIMSNQGEAIAIMEAEGSILKDQLKASHDDILLKAYTMEAFSQSARGSRTVYLKHPCLAISIMIQEIIAEQLFAKQHFMYDGLLPRFLICLVNKTVDICGDLIEVPQQTEIAYREKIHSLLSIERPMQHGNPKHHEIALSPAAATIHLEYLRDIQRRKSLGEFETHEAFGEKLAGHAVRLAGALHLFQHNLPHQHPISAGTMTSAICLANYFAANAAVAFNMEHTKGLRIAHKLLEWIQEHRRDQFTLRDAQRRIGRTTSEDIRYALCILERHGFIGTHTTPKRSTCIVNPRMFYRFL